MTSGPAGFVRRLVGSVERRDAWLSFAMATSLMLGLCLMFEPRWETNDDVAMSMVARGYGIAAQGSPQLVFSKVVWGWLVRSIPSVNGVLGYSIASMAALWLAAWVSTFSLLRLGAGLPLTLGLVALAFLRPVLFPQFTLAAGLLTMAAVLAWTASARSPSPWLPFVAAMLACGAFLIRSFEFLLVMLVAAPLIPWKSLRNRRMLGSVACLLAGVLAAVVVEQWMYGVPEWQRFVASNRARAPFTDFGFGAFIHANPALATQHGLSMNDVDLISAWFLVDPKLSDPQTLFALARHGAEAVIGMRQLVSGFAAIPNLWTAALLPVLVPALAHFVLVPRWRVAVAWLACVLVMFALGVVGRPGADRVYLPLISLLLVAPLLTARPISPRRRMMMAGVVALACVVHAARLMPASIDAERVSGQIRHDARSLPNEMVVSWSGRLPLESMYPPFGNDIDLRARPIYGMGVMNSAPHSVSVREEAAGRGLIRRLTDASGVLAAVSERHVTLLEGYCREHLGAKLIAAVANSTPSIKLQRLRCSTDPSSIESN